MKAIKTKTRTSYKKKTHGHMQTWSKHSQAKLHKRNAPIRPIINCMHRTTVLRDIQFKKDNTQFTVYRNPAQTDIIIPNNSCRDRCYAAARSQMDWLRSDHVTCVFCDACPCNGHVMKFQNIWPQEFGWKNFRSWVSRGLAQDKLIGGKPPVGM
jgi:hypothetical protein